MFFSIGSLSLWPVVKSSQPNRLPPKGIKVSPLSFFHFYLLLSYISLIFAIVTIYPKISPLCELQYF